jgi:hypothetical protein
LGEMFWQKKRKASPRAHYFWMLRLAERFDRREQFLSMHAPELMVELEERLVHEGMDRLTAGESLFVMRYRNEIARDFEPSEPSSILAN